MDRRVFQYLILDRFRNNFPLPQVNVVHILAKRGKSVVKEFLDNKKNAKYHIQLITFLNREKLPY